MKPNYSPHFLRNYSKAPADIQRAFEKQALLLLENPRHPSLRTKKYDESAWPQAGPRHQGLAFLLHN